MNSLFRLQSQEVFVRAPDGACVMAGSFYTQPEGVRLGSFHWQMSRSDTIDVAYSRTSPDNGRTWTQPMMIVTCEKRAEGTLRRFVYPGYVDPKSGALLFVYMQGMLHGDNPVQDGVRQWCVYYAVSKDGGETRIVDEQLICAGEEYSASHPLPGQWVGKNATQVAATTCIPITLEDGTILVPCQMSPLGADGEYYNPGGGHTYKEALVLRGEWQEDHRLKWQAGERVQVDPSRTTRGLLEPTLGVLHDGRVLMVMRGSNDVRPELPGTKWFATSHDGGRSWSTPMPWTYTDGEVFFSPSACSQLLQHSSGRLLWLGNISPENPRGNSPRYPLVIGEVDRKSGLLKRDSIFAIDDRHSGEHESMHLSNFYAREDRETGDVILHCSRLFANRQPDAPLDWTADALQYRIAIVPAS